MHTHKHRAGKKACLRMVVISRRWCLIELSLQLTESLAFRSHCFYRHVCAESTLEIIYGFKNTDIVHSFGVILLYLFWCLLIHTEALNWKWRQSRVWRVVCVCVCVRLLTRWWLVWESGNWTDFPVWIHSWSCCALFIICEKWEAQTPVQCWRLDVQYSVHLKYRCEHLG